MNTLNQRINNLKKTFQELQLKLQPFIDENTGLFKNPTDEALVLLLNQEKVISESLKSATEAWKQMNEITEKEAKQQSDKIQAIQKIVQGHMQTCPTKCKFEINSNPVEFIELFIEFIQGCLKENETKLYMLPLLKVCMKDDPRTNAFNSHLMKCHKVIDEPNALKNEFLSYFCGNSWKASQLTQLVGIAMGREEPSSYCARLSKLVQQNGISINETNPFNQLLIACWFNRLPHSIQNTLQEKIVQIMEKGTIQEYVDLIVKSVPHEPSHILKVDLHCPYCPKTVEFSCSCKTGNMLSKKHKRQTNEKENKQEPQPKKPKHNIEKNEELKKKGLCFKCGTKWSPTGHVCKKSEDMVAALTLDADNQQKEEWVTIIDNSLLYSITGTTQSRPTCDLYLNDIIFMNLNIDTLADKSILSMNLFQKLNIELQNTSLNLLAANGTSLVIKGAVQVKVHANGIEPFWHEFLVVETLGPVSGIVGLDLQSKLGIELANVPEIRLNNGKPLVAAVVVDDDQNKAEGTDLKLSLTDCMRQLKSENKGSQNYFDLFCTFRNRLCESLKDIMKKNDTITGFCTHPAAIIRLETDNEEPVFSRQYPLPFVHRKIATEQVFKWYENGTIEKETALDHSNHPVMVVPKRDISGNIKDWRTCIDPRKMNLKIRSSTFPLPTIRDIFESLSGKIVFSLIDLKSGFNQIMIYDPDRKKTAFTWNGVTYHFVGSPFGFKNIPQDFQRIISKIFADYPFVFIYIDDIIVASDSFEDHVKHVKKVFEVLNEFNLRANVNKCQIAFDRIIILGNEISSEGIRIAKAKLLKMDTWKNPVNLKMLQSQLGFLNYFRDYIPGYSKLLAPIEALRSQGDKLQWLPAHTLIMEKIRNILETEILLQFPDFDLKFYVGTDASKYGISAVLYQIDKNGKKKYLRFASESLSPSERNYGAPQRELLAVLFALRSFRAYLFGRHFTIYTDHKSLTYLLSKEKVSSVIQNWMDEILGYDFEMVHLPGIENHLPDVLSRFYDNDPRLEDDKPRYILQLTADEIISNVYTSDLDNLELLEDNTVQQTLMKRAHLEGHLGAADMARKIRSTKLVTWPNMVKDCQNHVSACIQCQRYNIGKHGYHPPKNIMALLPFDHVCIDLKEMPTSTKGNCYYLLLIDVATRFIFIRPLKDKFMYSIAQSLLKIFCDIGFPKILQSDNGSEFVNAILEALNKISKIDERHIAPYHHRANGMVERAIGTTSQAVYKAFEGMIGQWDDYCPAIQYHFNTRVLEIHGSSPYALLFARQPNDGTWIKDGIFEIENDEKRQHRLLFLNSIVYPAIFEKVKKQHKTRNDYFVKKHLMLKTDFPNGSQVMIRDELRKAKYEPKYEGPFTVIRRQASGNYLMRSVDGTEYVRPPNVLKLVSPEIVKDLNLQESIYAAVDKILEHRTVNDDVEYLVRWKDQSANFDSWLKKSDFMDIGPIIQYEKGLNKRPSNKPAVKLVTGNKSNVVKKLAPSIPVIDRNELTEHSTKRQTDVLLDIDSKQQAAVGKYWRTMDSKRHRSEPVIESDDD
jgi:transposase InsO family protein